jgi:hypothetical protein
MESLFRPALRAILSPVEKPPVKDTIRTSRDLMIVAATSRSP